MSENGRIYEKDNGARAFTASLSGRGIFTMGLILFVVLGSIGLGVGTVAGANKPANVVIETSVSHPLEVSPGDWVEISVLVENVGEKAIVENDGRLRIGICGPNEIEGHGIKVVRFDLDVNEKKTFKVGWMVPETAPSGEYRADAIASFYIGNIPYGITEYKKSRCSAYFDVTGVTSGHQYVPKSISANYDNGTRKGTTVRFVPVTTATPMPESTPTPEAPGFEAIFAIAGLLAVAYLVHRRKK